MPKVEKKQSVLRKKTSKRKKRFRGSQKQDVAKKRKETPAIEVTFVGEDDVVSEQIPTPAESASMRKIQLSDHESSSDESNEDDLEPAEGYRLVSMDSLLKFDSCEFM